MPRNAIFLLVVLAASASAAAATAADGGIKGATAERLAEVEEAVGRTLAGLTLEQKARQLDMYHGVDFLSEGVLNETAARAILNDGVGLIHDLYPLSSTLSNRLQQIALEGDSGVPALFVEECLHGLEQRDHSVFPSPIAMGAMFDPEAVGRVSAAIGAEARAYGIRMCLAPVLGVAREPRWGRQEELYSESPFLNAAYARAYVGGLQGERLGNATVVAEPKHFAAHSVPQGGRNAGPTHLGRRELESVFLPPFRAAFKDAGALAVMAAYSELDGIPCPSNPFLLNETLRGSYGFRGFVLSDLGAIAELQGTHRVVATAAEAVLLYLRSGGNAQFYDYPNAQFQQIIVGAVRNGTLPEAVLDARVSDVLRVKELLRLREEPFTDPSIAHGVVASPAHQAVALDAARRAIVLLANRNGTLPLRRPLPAVALIGSSAFEPRWGDYSGGGGNVNNRLSVTLDEAVTNLTAAGGTRIFREWGTGVSSPYELNAVHRPHLRGLTGSYWYGMGLLSGGPPALQRRDEEINFQFYHYGFNNSMTRPHTFSARWTASLVPPVSIVNATFALSFGGAPASGGARLWLNNTLVVDAWNVTAHGKASVFTGTHTLREGAAVPLRVEYFRLPGDASFALEWALAGAGGMARAVAAAEAARDAGGVAVVCVGDSTQSSGEDHDRARLGLPGLQEELVEAVMRTNVTTVVVMLSGRAAAVPYIASRADALLEGFGLGQAQGTALAEVLFGEVNPAGRLPVTFPVEVGQVQMFFDHMPSSRKDYQYLVAQPLFPFGFGLSYTNFTYVALRAPRLVSRSFAVNATVRNTGPVAGDEVVQLYMRDVVSSVTTPVRQLRGFRRVTLQPGQSVTVSFPVVVPDDLALFSRDEKWVAENGTFTFFVGGSSDNTPLNTSVVLRLGGAAPIHVPPRPHHRSGLSTGTSIAIGFGAAAIVVMLAALVACAVKRRDRGGRVRHHRRPPAVATGSYERFGRGDGD